MEPTRRQFLQHGAAAGFAGAITLRRGALAAAKPVAPRTIDPPPASANADAPFRSVLTPDGASLSSRLLEGVRVFHLEPGAVEHEFAPGLVADCWGYNGRVHGPTLEMVEGERVRIYVTNRLPAPTTLHWHGVAVPSGMDGVGGLSQRPIEPGETFKYEWTPPRAGTFMYHSHHDEMTQMALGLMGMLVVHPREPETAPPDHDVAYLLSEWKLTPGTRRPDPNEMTDFNVLTLNARIFPGTETLLVKRGDRVRIRIGNLSAMDHHPIHLHGHHFEVVATDGGEVPRSARFPETTVLVPVGTTRTIEFTADNAGDWALHCHMTHHVMTQMGHGIPNLVGVDPGAFDEQLGRAVPAYETMGDDDALIPKNSLPMMGGGGPHGAITMGGMFTILKVREAPSAADRAGWHQDPPGTRADLATPEELARDGIAPR